MSPSVSEAPGETSSKLFRRPFFQGAGGREERLPSSFMPSQPQAIQARRRPDSQPAGCAAPPPPPPPHPSPPGCGQVTSAPTRNSSGSISLHDGLVCQLPLALSGQAGQQVFGVCESLSLAPAATHFHCQPNAAPSKPGCCAATLALSPL